MASHYEAPIRRPLVTGEKSYHDVSVDVAAPVEGRANKQWWIVFSIAFAAFAVPHCIAPCPHSLASRALLRSPLGPEVVSCLGLPSMSSNDLRAQWSA